MRETQETIGRWSVDTFGRGNRAWPYARRIYDEVMELLDAATRYDHNPTHENLQALKDELADTKVTVHVFGHVFGIDVDGGVDAKMKINRYEREWIPNGDGTGRHKKKT